MPYSQKCENQEQDASGRIFSRERRLYFRMGFMWYACVYVNIQTCGLKIRHTSSINYEFGHGFVWILAFVPFIYFQIQAIHLSIPYKCIPPDVFKPQPQHSAKVFITAKNTSQDWINFILENKLSSIHMLFTVFALTFVVTTSAMVEGRHGWSRDNKG